MSTIDTVVIGAGHAGLAVSRLLTEAGRDHVVLDRGRVAERWRTERWDSLHLLTPSWMTRLPGWQLRAARSGRLHAAPASSSRYLERYAASFDAPVVERHDRARGRPRRRRRLPGRHRPRHLAGPPRRHRHRAARHARTSRRRLDARPGRRTCSTAQRLPQPRPAAGRAACSSWAPRPRACRSPTSSPAPAARSSSRSGGTPGCRAATAAWTSSGGWSSTGRLARTIDEIAGPDGRATRAVAAAGRARRARRARRGPRPGHAAGRGRPAGRTARRRRRPARCGFADDLADHVRPPTRRMPRFLDAVDRHIDGAGLTARGVGPRATATGRRSRPPPTGIDLRAEGIGTVLLADRVPPAPPVAAGAGRRAGRAHRAAPRRDRRRRACTSSASGSSTAATPASSTGPGTTPAASSPTCCGRDDCRARAPGARHDHRLRRRRRRWPGGRRLHRAAAGPGRRPGARPRAVAATAATRCRPTRLMRAGVLQLTRWGLLDRVVAAGTPAVRRTAFHYADDEPVQVSIRPSAGRRRAVRPAPAPARPDPRGRRGGGRRRGAARRRVTGLLRDDRPGGRRPRRRRGRARRVESRRRTRGRGRDPVGGRRRGRRSRRAARAVRSSAVRYPYVEGLPAAGYEWAYGDGGGAPG